MILKQTTLFGCDWPGCYATIQLEHTDHLRDPGWAECHNERHLCRKHSCHSDHELEEALDGAS